MCEEIGRQACLLTVCRVVHRPRRPSPLKSMDVLPPLTPPSQPLPRVCLHGFPSLPLYPYPCLTLPLSHTRFVIAVLFLPPMLHLPATPHPCLTCAFPPRLTPHSSRPPVISSPSSAFSNLFLPVLPPTHPTSTCYLTPHPPVPPSISTRPPIHIHPLLHLPLPDSLLTEFLDLNVI